MPHTPDFFSPDLGADLATLGRVWLRIFPHEYGRYVVFAAGAFLLFSVLFRRRLQGRKIRTASPAPTQLRREFAVSTRTAAVFAVGGLLTFVESQLGLAQFYRAPADRGWLYFAASIVIVIVVHDAWFYWTHRLIHDPRLFRRVHRTHHRSNNPSPFAAYSFDLGEAAINAAFVPLIVLIVPVTKLAMIIFMTHMIARNVVGHSGYELFPATRQGRPLLPFLTTVTHHDLHHANAGWNYGLYFTWWDRLMGTEHPLYAEKFAAAVRRPLDGSAVGALRRRVDAGAEPVV